MSSSKQFQRKSMPAVIAGCAALFGLSDVADAAAFGPYSVVVERIGGTADFTGQPQQVSLSAAPVFVDEFSIGAHNRLQTISLGAEFSEYFRNDTHNGYMTRTADGTKLVTTGYSLAPDTTYAAGAPSVISTANARRPLAIIGMDGSVNTSTTYRWSSSAAQRSVASPDGTTGFYIPTNSTTATGQGLRYVAGTGTTPQQTPAASAGRMVTGNYRTTRIYGDTLFASGTSTANSLVRIGDTGVLPTGSPDPAFVLPTTTWIGVGAGYRAGQFVLLDRNANGFDDTVFDTIYIAVEDTADTGGDGGMQKWTYDGTAWTKQYTLTALPSEQFPTPKALLGLDYAGDDANGNPILYATTTSIPTPGPGGAHASQTDVRNQLVRFVDDGNPLTLGTVVATSPTNGYFRGVAVVPEPTSLALLGLGAAGLMVRRRRQ